MVQVAAQEPRDFNASKKLDSGGERLTPRATHGGCSACAWGGGSPRWHLPASALQCRSRFGCHPTENQEKQHGSMLEVSCQRHMEGRGGGGTQGWLRTRRGRKEGRLGRPGTFMNKRCPSVGGTSSCYLRQCDRSPFPTASHGNKTKTSTQDLFYPSVLFGVRKNFFFSHVWFWVDKGFELEARKPCVIRVEWLKWSLWAQRIFSVCLMLEVTDISTY